MRFVSSVDFCCSGFFVSMCVGRLPNSLPYFELMNSPEKQIMLSEYVKGSAPFLLNFLFNNVQFKQS